MALSVVLDHAQRRLQRDRIAVLAAGLDLNGPYFQDTFIDPITRTLMLRPGPLYAEWYTSNTGKTAKIAPAELTFQTSDNWHLDGDYKMGDLAAGPWVSSKGNAPGWAMTNEVWPKNRAMYLSTFIYGAGDNYIVNEFGWGTTANYLTSISGRLWSGGDLEIYEGGELTGVYNVSGAALGDQKANQLIDLFLIPCRRRELLVFSRQGNGFSHVLESISEDDAAPIITPSAKFWVNFPTAKAQFQLAPIRYPVTGYTTTVDYQLGEAPESGDVLETFSNPAFAGGAAQEWRIFGDPSYVSDPTTTKAYFVSKTNGTFTPDGSDRDCRVRLVINDGAAGDFANYTPFIYGAEVAFETLRVDTNDAEETPVDDYLEELSIDVPDDATRVSIRTAILQPELVQATVAANLLRTNNRPGKIVLGELVWADLQGDSPGYDKSTSDATQRCVLEWRDRWKTLENYRFRTRIPLDGLTLTAALRLVMRCAGFDDDDLDLEEVSFPIEAIPGREAGDFNVIIEVGDTAAEWVMRLMEDYAATYFYGFKPTTGRYKFHFKSEATLSAAPVAYELWPSRQEAIDAGILPVDAWKHVYRKYHEDSLPIEANDIRVTGWDRRLRRAIQSWYPDEASKDPTVAPSDREDNWWGDTLLFGLVSSGINTQRMCNEVAEILHDALAIAPLAAEIVCETMVTPDGIPIWRGDDVMLHGVGRFRVLSLGIDAQKEPRDGDAWQWREATYCLERKVAA